MRLVRAMAFLATLPALAAGGALPWLAGAVGGDEPGPHVCVCPIGPDGSCECVECIRLHIHDPAPAHEEADPRGPAIRSACDDTPGTTAAPRSLPAVGAPRTRVIASSRLHVRREPACSTRPPEPVGTRVERPPRDRCARA